ncbi:PAS domain-containing protein [Geitlerinema sp. CS-897]|nr:PAS domain-containing protein [Geitlerinema sp. CS-897]
MSDLANPNPQFRDDRDREIAELRSRLSALEHSFLSRQTALSNVIANIRATLDLEEIFRTTTREVRQLLDADRVGIFRWFSESSNQDGEFIAEDVASGYDSALAARVRDYCFGGEFARDYVRGRVQAVTDIYDAGLSDCHIDILSRFQVRANLVVPLNKNDELWGLLCVHQCRAPRAWSESDVEFARQIALHLDVAIQQAEMLDRLRQQNQQQIERIATNVPGVIYQFRLDADGSISFPYFSAGNDAFAELSPRDIERNAAHLVDRIHPDDRRQFDESVVRSARTLTLWEWEGRMTMPSGTVRWMEARARPERQEDGTVVWYGWFNDCTEQKAIEEERQLLVSLVENSSDIIGVAGLNGFARYVNAAGRQTLGISPDEDVTSRRLSEFFPAETFQYIEQQVLPVAFETGRWRGEVQFRHFQTDEPIPVDYHLFTITHPKTGQCMGLATATRDMSEYKRVERELQASKEFLQLVIDSIPQLVVWKNRDAVFLGGNRRVADQAGLDSVAALIGKTDRDMPWQEAAEGYVTCDRRVMDTNTPEYHTIALLPQPDGTVRYLDTNRIPLRDEAGQAIGVVVTAEDVTERQQAEETLQRTLADLSAIIDNLADGLLVTDTAGRITRFNPKLRSMFEVSEGNLIDRTCAECGLLEVATLVDRVQKTPSEQVLTAELPLSENRIGQALAKNVFKETSEDDNFWSGSVILIRDVTLEKEVDRMKTDFISTVSHELRTPLTSVLGFASIVQEKLEESVFPLVLEGDRKVQKHVRRVRQNLDIIISEAERLTVLINDVLDIAKMEAGKVEWNMTLLSAEELLDRALAATSALIDGKNIEIRREVEPDLPEIYGDRDRLIQVVINLLSNAVKFTDEGTITCRVEHRDNYLCLSVQDTGIGIAPEDIDKVFDKFKQVGETLTDKPKGTGLGLPICQQILEHHGGRIWAESQFGEGSTFSFTLPIGDPSEHLLLEGRPNIDIAPLMQQLQEHTATGGQTNAARSQKTILVVDDDEHVRELLRQSLEAQGYQVKQAKDGVEAIAQVKRSRPDLIVLDVMMPYIDGFDVAAVLKNEPQTMKIPILVLSIIEDRERGVRVGVDRYLTKPIDRQGLLREVGSLLSQGSSKKKVLVVDRDASALKVLSEVLAAQGYSVAEASTDLECIEKALSLKPDIIAIDSGFFQQHDIVKTLRFEKGLENVLFVLLGDRQESR